MSKNQAQIKTQTLVLTPHSHNYDTYYTLTGNGNQNFSGKCTYTCSYTGEIHPVFNRKHTKFSLILEQYIPTKKDPEKERILLFNCKHLQRYSHSEIKEMIKKIALKTAREIARERGLDFLAQSLPKCTPSSQ